MLPKFPRISGDRIFMTLEIACFKDPTGIGLIDISRILTECLKLVLSPTLACLIIIKYGSLDV
jgi:hypothetical protein